MPTERSVNSTIRTTLINNEPFEYAHLVKFERPQLPNANNTFSTNANKFGYHQLINKVLILYIRIWNITNEKSAPNIKSNGYSYPTKDNCFRCHPMATKQLGRIATH